MHDSPQAFQPLSAEDFLAFGMSELAYVRQLSPESGAPVGIFAADGSQMAVMANHEVAVAAIRQHGLEPHSLH